jgi:hypothetical protein
MNNFTNYSISAKTASLGLGTVRHGKSCRTGFRTRQAPHCGLLDGPVWRTAHGIPHDAGIRAKEKTPFGAYISILLMIPLWTLSRQS